MLSRYYLIAYISLCIFYAIKGADTIETDCNINGGKSLQHVSENFLSLSIDPAVLLAGLNLSETSLHLARQLSPAYIRIAGPSTRFVKYEDSDDKIDDNLSEDGNNVVVTPSMWFGINEWLKLANLTPVFGINDVETTGEVWDPASTLPLLEISDKFNVSCYWLLGFDSSGKNETRYKQELSAFQNILRTFTNRDDSWKIVGSDISRIPREETGTILEDLSGIAAAVMWEPEVVEEAFPEKYPNTILESQNKTVELWTTAPKPSQPVSFSSALLWAMHVGDAAKMGYDVVFRQPRLHEMFSDTPIYWFSLLHKKLMGRSVLEAEPVIHHQGSSVYAHCMINQNGFNERGGLTLMIVNNNLESYKVKVKLEEVQTGKYMEVQSYIMTSLTENSTDTFLNGKHLTPGSLFETNTFDPKLRVTKFKPHLSLKVPPMSIGFFVLPNAGLPICTNEGNAKIVPKDIDNNVNLHHSNEAALTLQSRSSFIKNPVLQEFKEKIINEMDMDTRFSNNDFMLNLNALKQRIQESVDDEIDPFHRRYNVKKTAMQEKPDKTDLMKRREELKKIISEKSKRYNVESRPQYLDLTNEEMEKILKDRAKARAARKNIFLTEDELDIIVETVRKKYLKSRFKRSVPLDEIENENSYIQPELLSKNEFQVVKKRSARKTRDLNMKLINLRSKLEDNRQRFAERRSDLVGNAHNLKTNMEDRMRQLKHKNHRLRRDINMDLLKLKTDSHRRKTEEEVVKPQFKSFFKDEEQKARKPGRTSDELLAELEEEESDEEPFISEESEEENMGFFNIDTKPKTIGLFDRKWKINQFATTKPNNKVTKLKNRKNKNDFKAIDDPIKFLTSSEEFNDEEDLSCIHEYFGPLSRKPNEKNQVGQTRKKLKKEGNRKMTDVSDESISDSMEYLRKKRNQVDKCPVQELREVDYDIVINKNDDAPDHELETSIKDDENTSPADNKDKGITLIGKKSSRLEGKVKTSENSVQKLGMDESNSKDQFAKELEETEEDSTEKSDFIGTKKIEREQFGNHKSTKLRKRDIKDPNEVEMDKAGGNNGKSIHQVQLKQRLKELQQTVVKDTLKLQQDIYNKYKIKEPKKDQRVKLEHRILSGNDKIDKDKTKEVLEKLQLLREKMKQKTLDQGQLTNDAKLSEGNKDKKLKLSTRLASKLKQPEVNANKRTEVNSDVNNNPLAAPDGTTNQVPVRVVKRSLFNRGCDVFGNYKSITPDLKAWKPSDILSLKRDVNFLTAPKLRPANDFQLFKNIITPNKFFNFRRRRSIMNNLDDLDNKIDSYINDIEKDDTYVLPKPRKNEEETDYKLPVPVDQEKIQSVALKSPNEIKQIRVSETLTTTKTTPILDELGKEIKNVVDTSDNITTVFSGMSENIQRIPTKQEQSFIDTLVHHVSGFFTNIGKALEHYLKNMS